MRTDRHDLLFLESSSNLKGALKMSQGWVPSTTQASEIIACLRQGRLFYAAASEAPLEIKPLQLYYGMTAFAKAVVLATDRSQALNSLPQSHGVKDMSATDSYLADLEIAIDRKGTFQVFNDCVSKLNRLSYIAHDTSDQHLSLHCAASSSLVGMRVSLKELLSRVPSLDELYSATFSAFANSSRITLNQHLGQENSFYVRIDDRRVCETREQLRQVVVYWRAMSPFLEKWTLRSAEFAWGKTALMFENVRHEGDDLSEQSLSQQERKFSSQLQFDSENRHADIRGCVDSTIGGYLGIGEAYFIKPIDGKSVSTLSLHFLALHLLSSLVRYRPSIWMHSLSRATSASRQSDDASLALIEKFLEVNESLMPDFVCEVLNPKSN